MVDVHNKQTRSYNMSRIKGQDTKPEMQVQAFLFAQGLRFVLHPKDLPGKPDLCFYDDKIAIFINGCFWHGHENCKYFKIPETRTDWWKAKIEATIERDKRNRMDLINLGWRVLTVWGCELKPQSLNITLENLFSLITCDQRKSND